MMLHNGEQCETIRTTSLSTVTKNLNFERNATVSAGAAAVYTGNRKNK